MNGDRTDRTSWLRLNADGLFIGVLAITAGLFDILQPDYQALQEALGHEPLMYWVWSALFALGGCLMIAGLVAMKVGTELLGRMVIIVAACMELGMLIYTFGWLDSSVWDRYVLVFIITFFFGLRASSLLRRGGVAVVVGGKPEDTT